VSLFAFVESAEDHYNRQNSKEDDMKSSVIRQALVASSLVTGMGIALPGGALLILSSRVGGYATPAGTMLLALPYQHGHNREDEV
jgi:hypothetical protein